MKYWLIKSDPDTWGWTEQCNHTTTHWDGVRNYQARNNMQAMAEGDLCFFYHSQTERRIVGIVKVVKTFYPDPTDDTGKFGMVDVTVHAEIPQPVALANIKADDKLADMALVKNSRLSVMPVTADQWKRVCKLGEYKPAK